MCSPEVGPVGGTDATVARPGGRWIGRRSAGPADVRSRIRGDVRGDRVRRDPQGREVVMVGLDPGIDHRPDDPLAGGLVRPPRRVGLDRLRRPVDQRVQHIVRPRLEDRVRAGVVAVGGHQPVQLGPGQRALEDVAAHPSRGRRRVRHRAAGSAGGAAVGCAGEIGPWAGSGTAATAGGGRPGFPQGEERRAHRVQPAGVAEVQFEQDVHRLVGDGCRCSVRWRDAQVTDHGGPAARLLTLAHALPHIGLVPARRRAAYRGEGGASGRREVAARRS